MDTPEISVVIIPEDQADALPVVLAHLEQQTFPAARFEIIAVDNASSDASNEVAQRFAAGAPVRTRCFRVDQRNLAAARNLAVREAQGRYVLFISDDLLAGPELLVHHAEAQRDFGDACVVGAVDLHPQMDPHFFSPWFMPEERREFPADSLLPYLDWRHMNCSLPRKSILDAGGYDERFGQGFFEDRELAFRLSRRGLRGHYLSQAHAYIWRAADLAVERRKHFAKGYALYHFAQKANPREVLSRYNADAGLLRRIYESAVIPFYVRACHQSEGDMRVVGHLYRRILAHDMSQGYRAAARGKEL